MIGWGGCPPPSIFCALRPDGAHEVGVDVVDDGGGAAHQLGEHLAAGGLGDDGVSLGDEVVVVVDVELHPAEARVGAVHGQEHGGRLVGGHRDDGGRDHLGALTVHVEEDVDAHVVVGEVAAAEVEGHEGLVALGHVDAVELEPVGLEGALEVKGLGVCVCHGDPFAGFCCHAYVSALGARRHSECPRRRAAR